jgi:hypothetical protein
MGRPVTLRRRPVGMTIGRLMLVSVAVAAVGWLFRMDAPDSPWELGLEITVGVAVVARIFILLLYARQCPVCGKSTLARVKAVSFGDHYLRCSSCGQRAKRSWLGRLWDASGPEDDRYFEPSVKPVTTWSDGPILPSAETSQTRTVGTLLRGKLHREELGPETVEIAAGESDGTVQSEKSRMSPHKPTARLAPSGVKQPVAERFFRTLDAIRWARNSRR